MRPLTYLLTIGVTAVAVGLCSAQPKGGRYGQPGPEPRLQGPGNSRNLEERLEKLDAQLKEIEKKLGQMQGPPKKDPPGVERKGPMPSRPEPGQFGPFGGTRFGGFGGGMGFPPGPFGMGMGGPPASRPADFERRLDRIISELEQLKKDLKAAPAGPEPMRSRGR